MGTLTGRVALITGGGRGIGQAIAMALAQEGADVALSGRTPEVLTKAKADIIAMGRGAMAIRCDVCDSAQVTDMVRQVSAELGPPLILVNNAGIALSAKLTDTTDAMWARAMETNASGAFYCMRAVLPAMRQAGWGRIINIASVASRIGAAYLSAYSASKHALLGLTRSVALEVATQGITINALCPGYVDTEMTERSVANIVQRTGRSEATTRGLLDNMSPQRRLMTVQEIASAAIFLCQETARGINGQGLMIDGGGVQA